MRKIRDKTRKGISCLLDHPLSCKKQFSTHFRCFCNTSCSFELGSTCCPDSRLLELYGDVLLRVSSSRKCYFCSTYYHIREVIPYTLVYWCTACNSLGRHRGLVNLNSACVFTAIHFWILQFNLAPLILGTKYAYAVNRQDQFSTISMCKFLYGKPLPSYGLEN